MTQFHARANFNRVAVIKAIQNRLTGGWLYTRETAHIYDSPRFKRLCRIVALYRTAGFLFPQEI